MNQIACLDSITVRLVPIKCGDGMSVSGIKSTGTASIPPMKDNICAIVVTYFPDEHFIERLDQIRTQVARTIIIDNTGEANPSSLLDSMVIEGVELNRNRENLGIAEALNQGLFNAIALGFDWTITFDQDSWVHPDLVNTLIDIYQQQAKPELIGIIGCNIEDSGTHKSPNKYKADGQTFTETGVVITSGAMMSVAVFTAAGPFRSDFFIDFVDMEYCLRLRKLGYKVLTSTAPLMVHALWEATFFSFGNGPAVFSLVLTNRPPLRRYYMTRNAILVAKCYYRLAPEWGIRTLASILLFAMIKIPLEKQNRAKKFRATVWGAFDALRGKTGKTTASWLG